MQVPIRMSLDGAEQNGPHLPPLLGEHGPWAPGVLSLLPAGLESRFRNKSGYLRYSCESRIRSYLREVGPH